MAYFTDIGCIRFESDLHPIHQCMLKGVIHYWRCKQMFKLVLRGWRKERKGMWRSPMLTTSPPIMHF